jgi:hypothetical protein
MLREINNLPLGIISAITLEPIRITDDTIMTVPQIAAFAPF